MVEVAFESIYVSLVATVSAVVINCDWPGS